MCNAVCLVVVQRHREGRGGANFSLLFDVFTLFSLLFNKFVADGTLSHQSRLAFAPFRVFHVDSTSSADGSVVH